MFDKIKTNVSGKTGEAAAGGVDYPVKPDNDGNRAEQANNSRKERADKDREGEEWQQRGKRRGRFKKERREPKPPPLYISR